MFKIGVIQLRKLWRRWKGRIKLFLGAERLLSSTHNCYARQQRRNGNRRICGKTERCQRRNEALNHARGFQIRLCRFPALREVSWIVYGGSRIKPPLAIRYPMPAMACRRGVHCIASTVAREPDTCDRCLGHGGQEWHDRTQLYSPRLRRRDRGLLRHTAQHFKHDRNPQESRPAGGVKGRRHLNQISPGDIDPIQQPRDL